MDSGISVIKFWKFIKFHPMPSRKVAKINNFKELGGNIIIDDLEKANFLAHHY